MPGGRPTQGGYAWWMCLCALGKGLMETYWLFPGNAVELAHSAARSESRLLGLKARPSKETLGEALPKNSRRRSFVAVVFDSVGEYLGGRRGTTSSAVGHRSRCDSGKLSRFSSGGSAASPCSKSRRASVEPSISMQGLRVTEEEEPPDTCMHSRDISRSQTGEGESLGTRLTTRTQSPQKHPSSSASNGSGFPTRCQAVRENARAAQRQASLPSNAPNRHLGGLHESHQVHDHDRDEISLV